MTERQRYEKYVAWCRGIGVRPAEFERWVIVMGGVDAKWGVIYRLNMGNAS